MEVRCLTLVLSRKIGEEIHIGNDIVVTIVSVEGSRIKVGISAPRNVPINRPDAKRNYGKTEGGDDGLRD